VSSFWSYCPSVRQALENLISGLWFKRLDDDLFLIQDSGCSAIFAPLRRVALNLKSSSSIVTELPYIKVRAPYVECDAPYNPTRLSLSLTSNCNLRCLYCYGYGGESAMQMNLATAQTAIRQVVKFCLMKEQTSFSLSFPGAGEPMLAWDLLVDVVGEAKIIARQNDLEVTFSMQTNGTMIGSGEAHWLADNGFVLGVSLDGPKDIHNYQRPGLDGKGSFDNVVSGLEGLVQWGVPFGLWATVTDTSVVGLVDLVRIACDVNAISLNVQLVSAVGRGEGQIPPLPSVFLSQYSRAYALAQKLDVKLKSSLNYLGTPRCRFCQADGNKFFVLSDGNVSSCTRVTSAGDDIAREFIIGKVDEYSHTVLLDQKQIARLRRLNVWEFTQCDDCFARWYCAGGCHHSRVSNGGRATEIYCTVVRSLLWESIKRSVNSATSWVKL
jgi:uncharacterized protein